MKWLLVVFVFTVNESGDVTSAESMAKAFATLEECNQVGESFREINELPPEKKSISTCVSRSAFDQTD